MKTATPTLKSTHCRGFLKVGIAGHRGICRLYLKMIVVYFLSECLELGDARFGGPEFRGIPCAAVIWTGA